MNRFPALLLCAALVLSTGCAGLHRTRTVELVQPSEIVYATADDGVRVALHHYEPLGVSASPTPVLVCHGISSNTHTWALGPGRDFGQYLASHGLDAWLVDLRGHGESDEVDPATSIDTYAIHDVPAIIDTVRQQTGASSVAWVGHSMGGLVLVAYLQRTEAPPLAAAVTVASPVDWRGEDTMTGLVRVLLGFFHGEGPLPTPNLAAFYAQWADELPMKLDKVVYAPDNMARPYLADMMRVGLSPIQAGVREQFKHSIEAGAFVSEDGSMNYLEGAESITVPFLVVAGRADRLCPPERTVTFFEKLGSEDKSRRVFGLDEGDAADYGHVDLCNGDHAEEDVYPFLTEWLLERIGTR